MVRLLCSVFTVLLLASSAWAQSACCNDPCPQTCCKTVYRLQVTCVPCTVMKCQRYVDACGRCCTRRVPCTVMKKVCRRVPVTVCQQVAPTCCPAPAPCCQPAATCCARPKRCCARPKRCCVRARSSCAPKRHRCCLGKRLHRHRGGCCS